MTAKKRSASQEKLAALELEQFKEVCRDIQDAIHSYIGVDFTKPLCPSPGKVLYDLLLRILKLVQLRERNQDVGGLVMNYQDISGLNDVFVRILADVTTLMGNLDKPTLDRRSLLQACVKAWDGSDPSALYMELRIVEAWAMSKQHSPKKVNRPQPKFKVKYTFINKRFAALIDSKNLRVRISRDALNFLLAYVDKRTGMPLGPLKPDEVVKKAGLKHRKPNIKAEANSTFRTPARVVIQWFNSIKRSINKSLKEKPFDRRSKTFEDIAKHLYVDKKHGMRQLNFSLVECTNLERPPGRVKTSARQISKKK